MLRSAPRKPMRTTLGVCGALIVVLALGWGLVWRLAAGQTEAILDAWMEHEHDVGRTWTCPERRIGGFPVSIEIACTQPTFEGVVAGRRVAGSLKSVRARAALYRPRAVTTEIESPFDLKGASEATEIKVSWTSLLIDLDGLPDVLEHLAIRAANPDVVGTVAGTGAVSGHAKTVDLLVNRLAERRDRAYTFTVDVRDATSPLLDAFFGSAAPALLNVAGTLTQADFSGAGTPADRMDRWRQADGRVEIDTVALRRGPMTLDAKGSLALDPAHRIRGKLDAQFSGFEPVLRRFGVNPSIVAAGSLIGALLGGSRNGQAPSTLRLPVAVENGQVSIGPVRTPLLVPPLY